jgi:hypothetical protein
MQSDASQFWPLLSARTKDSKSQNSLPVRARCSNGNKLHRQQQSILKS